MKNGTRAAPSHEGIPERWPRVGQLGCRRMAKAEQTGFMATGRKPNMWNGLRTRRARAVGLIGVVAALIALGACGPSSDQIEAGSSNTATTSSLGVYPGSTASSTDSSPPKTGSARVCRPEDVPTAGNRAQYFLGDVQQASLDQVTGGEDDPLGCAYDQLCRAVRDRVPEELFRATKGVAVSSVLDATSESGARHGDFALVGVDAQYDDVKTLDPSITTAWGNIDFKWYRSGSTRTETWRLDFIREDGSWRVCGFTKSS